jgi:hypothetical protein
MRLFERPVVHAIFMRDTVPCKFDPDPTSEVKFAVIVKLISNLARAYDLLIIPCGLFLFFCTLINV